MNNNTSAKTEKTFKQKLRTFFIFLIFISLLVIGLSIYLLVKDNEKYETYKTTAADIVDYEKVYKNGLTYYKGNYKYVVNKKEYYYTEPNMTTHLPDEIIRIKYDAKNPNNVYDENASKMFFIMLFVAGGFGILSFIIMAALTSSKVAKELIVQVIEEVNCVGGRRIYLNDISIKNNDKDFYTKKYYVYFSNDNKFKVGALLKFNLYKYGEAFTSEKYRNVSARVIYHFKDDDFEIVNVNKG